MEFTIKSGSPEKQRSACVVVGVFDNRNALISTPYGEVRDPNYFVNTKGVEARTETEVTAIDLATRHLTLRGPLGGEITGLDPQPRTGGHGYCAGRQHESDDVEMRLEPR